uniref:Uncharacterized protein n=1 Tax=Peronospora matthiolae TaxID=2874970 RepID=A0AAV1TQM7_9STRA
MPQDMSAHARIPAPTVSSGASPPAGVDNPSSNPSRAAAPAGAENPLLDPSRAPTPGQSTHSEASVFNTSPSPASPRGMFIALVEEMKASPSRAWKLYRKSVNAFQS